MDNSKVVIVVSPSGFAPLLHKNENVVFDKKIEFLGGYYMDRSFWFIMVCAAISVVCAIISYKKEK
ncbi:hypothetical protein [Facklamia miroungae]|uniref:hypothetical protein n=1 Tax=Facklamia miroungae TaxID=120956 RepID=UPI000B7C6DE2|nr:hypothetical protein [Facklamia miroungae]NKZ30022.1 hypothetical protein [Facklamia miroungae]